MTENKALEVKQDRMVMAEIRQLSEHVKNGDAVIINGHAALNTLTDVVDLLDSINNFLPNAKLLNSLISNNEVTTAMLEQLEAVANDLENVLNGMGEKNEDEEGNDN